MKEGPLNRHVWKIALGLTLLGLSALGYLLHWLIFRDAHHIFLYLLGDVAFVFVEVLLVTLIIHEMLTLREKRRLLEKLNMVIGAFFSEIGRALLSRMAALDAHADRIRQDLLVGRQWGDKDFETMSRRLRNYRPSFVLPAGPLSDLKESLLQHREFLLRLLENPNVLEHDSFTAVLLALFHLTEELAARDLAQDLPEADRLHITADMERVYRVLLREWAAYLRYLRRRYPYLFSFALRTNPFDRSASPTILEEESARA